MNQKSAKTLVLAGAGSLLFGMLVGAPAGSLFLYVVATLFTVCPTAVGKNGTRITGAIVLVISLLLAAATYPRYEGEMTKYRTQAKADSAPVVPR